MAQLIIKYSEKATHFSDALGQISPLTQQLSHISEPSSLSAPFLGQRSRLVIPKPYRYDSLPPEKGWERGFGPCFQRESCCLSSRCYSITGSLSMHSIWLCACAGGWWGGVGGTKDSGRAFVGHGEPGPDPCRVQPGNLRAGFVSTSSRSLSAVSVENCSEAERAGCVVLSLGMGIISSCETLLLFSTANSFYMTLDNKS